MSQLANKIIFRYKSHFETGSVLYKDIKQLLDKKDVIHIIEAYLLHVLKKSKVKIHHKLNNILKAIQNDQGINISKISHDFKISHRDLQRLFKRYIGVAPNVYIRINKIRNLKTIIANNRFDSLTQLSLDNGYFDQAHFIRDFKGFMQETPKKYYKIKNPN
jgi:AraC-like DNA-binding protein